jgi:hypothetical protein
VVFAEEFVRPLLVLHAVLAAALVASTTHLVLWMRRWPRGQFPRYAATRRFSYIALALFAATFALGNLLYPTYKVRVRIEYLENPEAVAAAARAGAEQASRIKKQHGGSEGDAAAKLEAGKLDADAVAARVESTRRMARWFDVKEHWVALGLSLAAACAVIMTFWKPGEGEESRAITPILFGLALGACATAWLGAVVGILTASFRAVG